MVEAVGHRGEGHRRASRRAQSLLAYEELDRPRFGAGAYDEPTRYRHPEPRGGDRGVVDESEDLAQTPGRARAQPCESAADEGLERVFSRILAVNLAEPRVFVHRDFMPRNLMVSEPNPGVIDFQDAVHGPISYDVASLWRDAFVSWEEERVLDGTIRYWEAARKRGLPVRADFADFWRDVEWMGLQRHLKVLGIFARIHYRDGKPGYLEDTPRFLGYVRHACARYGELAPLARLLDRLEGVKPAVGYTF